MISRFCYHGLPANEPLTDFTDSKIKTTLLKELQTIENEEIEIPCVVGGEKIYTGNIAYQVTVRYNAFQYFEVSTKELSGHKPSVFIFFLFCAAI